MQCSGVIAQMCYGGSEDIVEYLTFVDNRIGEIQSVTNPDQWRHVPTELKIEPCRLPNKWFENIRID